MSKDETRRPSIINQLMFESTSDLYTYGSPTLFRAAPPKLIKHYRQHAASEPPRELRWHPTEIRYSLLAALCWRREQKNADNLLELPIRVLHGVSVRTVEKVDGDLLHFAKKAVDKARLLYKPAKVAKEHQMDMLKDVIRPRVGEEILKSQFQDIEMVDRQVKVVKCTSYSYHYHRIVPASLKCFSSHSFCRAEEESCSTNVQKKGALS